MAEYITSETRVAIHEAGHVVIAHHFGVPIAKVKLGIDGDTCGSVDNLKQDISELKLKHSFWDSVEITSLQLLGGMVAEYIYDNKPEKIRPFGSSIDLKNIRWFFSEFKLKLTDQQILEMFFHRTLEILENKWKAVEALADILVEKRSINGKEASRIIEENI